MPPRLPLTWFDPLSGNVVEGVLVSDGATLVLHSEGGGYHDLRIRVGADGAVEGWETNTLRVARASAER